MVAYLEKSQGSEEFHQITNFLSTSHIKYALTKSPTIYASLIKQFWQTAALCTIENGFMCITATIDRKVKVLVIEASIRRHLKLEDSEGLNIVPTIEIFEQLALIGSGSGTVHKTPTRPHDSPLPKVQSLGSDAGRMTLSELTVLCTNLSNKILFWSLLQRCSQKRREVANVTSYTRRKRKISTAEEPVNTAGASKPVSTADMVQERVKDKEDLKEYLNIVLEEGMNIEALQTKDDRVKLWELVKERFSSTKPTDDKEKALWVELKRLFEPDTDDLLELQKYMHDPLTLRLYDACGVHHVSTKKGLDMFMLVEKDYPLTKGLLMLMLINKLQVDQHSEIADELLRKIFEIANRPRKGGLLGINLPLLVQELSTALHITTSTNCDPAMLRYHALQNRPYSVAEVRKNMYGIKFNPLYPWILKRKKLVKRKEVGRKHFPGKEQVKSKVMKVLKDKNLRMILRRKISNLSKVPEEGMNIEALLTKYPLIDWEIYTKDSRVYWKIIRVGDHTEIYQFFDDMLKNFDRDDLVKLWELVKERFSSTKSIDDKEKALWVE
ncbi:hypothetical protein Tco_0221568 [Tanacetum coccineum]